MNESENNPNLLSLILDHNLDIDFYVDSSVTIVFIIILILVVLFNLLRAFHRPWKSFELDEAQFGIGNSTVKLKPNNLDRQVAYKIWVELSTRKIGLEIDLDNDVVSEIYDSWYSFFSVTREMIKDVPVSKFREKDTEKIIIISIDVLNKGIRPHLTMWQARFRRWYENQLKNEDKLSISPQDIQKEFPEYEALKSDILQVNSRLIAYRNALFHLITAK